MQPKMFRCATYTRKSTEEGLEQEFNSLDAQREACAAYVTSQRHEGWSLVAHAYEDGGYSGGSMERPALQQLLADVTAGKIDIIVVYKVDRLTRSLADFAKIVEILDAKGASFVSVTQAFNTTTSMGRLTLNVLLSFAQFEREVTSERIRDKIAASKAKGMWMGGPVPLGYDLRDRKLLINTEEAAIVRRIFALYLQCPSLCALADKLRQEGIRSKARIYQSGFSRGGVFMTRGSLQQMLRNPIYRGLVAHKGKTYPGEHASIIEEALWDQVQRKLDAAAVERRSGSNAKEPSLLVGLVKDGHDRPMSPSHAVKGSRRYRYYVTHVDHEDGRPAWRVPAHNLEQVVVDRVCTWLEDRRFIADLIPRTGARAIAERIVEATSLARQLRVGAVSERRRMLRTMVMAIVLEHERIRITLDARSVMGGSGAVPEAIMLEAPALKIRIAQETRLVIAEEAGMLPVNRNAKLVRLIAEAHGIQEQLMSGVPLFVLAKQARSSPARISKLARLAWLAPDIVTAIVEGCQPKGLDRRSLMAATQIPLDWPSQRRMLGFA